MHLRAISKVLSRFPMHAMFSRLRTSRKSSEPALSKSSSDYIDQELYRPVCQEERGEGGKEEAWEACTGALGAGCGGRRQTMMGKAGMGKRFLFCSPWPQGCSNTMRVSKGHRSFCSGRGGTVSVSQA